MKNLTFSMHGLSAAKEQRTPRAARLKTHRTAQGPAGVQTEIEQGAQTVRRRLRVGYFFALNPPVLGGPKDPAPHQKGCGPPHSENVFHVVEEAVLEFGSPEGQDLQNLMFSKAAMSKMA